MTPGAFCQKSIFLDILEIFSLEMGQINSDVLKYWQHDSMPLFPLAPRFKTFLLRHVQKSKFLNKKVTHVLRFLVFLIFFCALSFSLFLIFLLQWLTFYSGLAFSSKNSESIIKTGKFYHEDFANGLVTFNYYSAWLTSCYVQCI